MKTNLLVDTSIFITILVAMEPRFSGMPLHEWLGVAMLATIIIHLLLHWKWIVGVGKNFFKKLWHTSRLKYALDVFLFVDFIGVIFSGLMISRSVLPTLGLSLGQVSMQWRTLHSLSADLVILLVGLHFALNWDRVVHSVRRILVNPLVSLFPSQKVLQPVPVRSNESIQKQG